VIERILRGAAAHYGVTVSQMMSVAQASHIVRARQTAMYMLRARTSLRLVEIAQMFHRSHSSVINAVSQTKWRIKWEPGYADALTTLLTEL